MDARLTDFEETDKPVACYRGTVRVHWRIRNYHHKGTIGGQMAVYGDRLKFSGVGIHRFELREYSILEQDIDEIHFFSFAEIPRILRFLPMRRFGIRVISKPGGSFNDRDEYTLLFNDPAPDEVLKTLRIAGYPVADNAGNV
jgi:hypothetical protein